MYCRIEVVGMEHVAEVRVAGRGSWRRLVRGQAPGIEIGSRQPVDDAARDYRAGKSVTTVIRDERLEHGASLLVGRHCPAIGVAENHSVSNRDVAACDADVNRRRTL